MTKSKATLSNTKHLRLLLWFGVVGIFLTVILLTQTQNTTITQLLDQGKTKIAFHFYPSTLRMINLEHIEAFDEMIEDIDKLILYTMNNKFDTKQYYELIQKLQIENKMEMYLEMDDSKQKIYWLGNEDANEIIGLVELNGIHYICDIAGKLNFNSIPNLYKYIHKNSNELEDKWKILHSIFRSVNSKYMTTK